MIGKTQPTEPASEEETEVTNCPECGTEWEVVVTRRAAAVKPGNPREE